MGCAGAGAAVAGADDKIVVSDARTTTAKLEKTTERTGLTLLNMYSSGLHMVNPMHLQLLYWRQSRLRRAGLSTQKDSVNPSWPTRGRKSLVIYPNDPGPED
jgi:hypothetical protein